MRKLKRQEVSAAPLVLLGTDVDYVNEWEGTLFRVIEPQVSRHAPLLFLLQKLLFLKFLIIYWNLNYLITDLVNTSFKSLESLIFHGLD